MSRRMQIAAPAFFLALLLASLMSCAPEAGTTTPASPHSASPLPGSESVVELAKKDLADRLGIPPAEVTLEDVREREWSDASLGCPEPGKAYAQVITPGYQITLRARGRTYEYHADRGTRVVTCQRSF